MLFQRRDKPTRLERLRVAVWPRHSWIRSFRYFSKRVLRLTASPNAVALGFAAGAMASITPLVGCHFLLSFLIAFIIGGNMLAAALGTAVGNPLTFPFIWASTYKVGTFILSGQPHHLTGPSLGDHLSVNIFEQSWEVLWPIFKPMFLGAVPLGLIVFVISYFAVFYSVRGYQTARRHRLEARRRDIESNTPSKGKRVKNCSEPQSGSLP